ncbi:MAG: aldo/keto reductase family protein [Candidatus Eremiobacteraeota bacterium]|nr:aldo/keto reductase family protein [Candidatus Eremiobacteraeota bacterium]
MRYRALGNSGLQVSIVGLGSWLTFGNTVNLDATRACVHAAWERGVNFLDTANVYASGAAEETLGSIISELERGVLVLATKVFFPTGDRVNERGLSRKHIRDQVERSLRRLHVDYIDLYQCHRFDFSTPLEETCAAMNDLVRAGKILYWGVSEWNADQIAAAAALCLARGWSVPISNQPQYSALWRRIEDRVIPICRRYGLGNVVWSPLAMGALSGKYAHAAPPPPGSRGAGPFREMMEDYLTQGVLDAVQRLVPIAKEAGCTLPQLAVAWCLRLPEISSAIVGATNVGHVMENVAAADLDVDPVVFEQMNLVLDPVRPNEPYLA